MAFGPLNLRPWEFGWLTPGEFHQLADGYQWRQKEEARGRIALAWHIAALSRQKRLPPLERLLKPDGGTNLKTVEERRVEYAELKQRLG